MLLRKVVMCSFMCDGGVSGGIVSLTMPLSKDRAWRTLVMM